MSHFQRKLDGLGQIIAALRLDASEKRDFIDSVIEASSRSTKRRREAKSRLDSRQENHLKPLSHDDFSLIANLNDYRVLTALQIKRPAKKTVSWLSGFLEESSEEIESALQRLDRLGLATFTENWKASYKNTEIPNQVSSSAVRSFHSSVLAKASEALDLVPAQNRFFTSSVLHYDRTRLGEVQEFLSEMMQKFERKFGSDEDFNTVGVSSFQFFPASQQTNQEIL